MNLRYLCYRTEVFPNQTITKSGIVLDTKALIDKDAKLDRQSNESFVVISVAHDNSAMVTGEDGNLRNVAQGDIIVPINQVQWEKQNDGTHKRNSELLVYPFWKGKYEDFVFIDQYEAIAVIPDKVVIDFIEE
jgi:hypothetical protein